MYICYPYPSLNQFVRRYFIRPDGAIKKKEKPGYNINIELFTFGAINALVLLFKPL